MAFSFTYYFLCWPMLPFTRGCLWNCWHHKKGNKTVLVYEKNMRRNNGSSEKLGFFFLFLIVKKNYSMIYIDWIANWYFPFAMVMSVVLVKILVSHSVSSGRRMVCLSGCLCCGVGSLPCNSFGCGYSDTDSWTVGLRDDRIWCEIPHSVIIDGVPLIDYFNGFPGKRIP